MTAPAELQTLDDIEIREGVEADNEALLALTKATPMAGRISLRIDREPDFFALSRARGESTFFVATSEGRVIGCVSVSLHDAYVGGQIERIAHGNDLKVHPEFAGKRIGVRLLLAAENHLRSQGIDISVSLFAEGNGRVVTLAEGRHGQAVSLPLGRFFVDQILPSPFRGRAGRYSIEEAGAQDIPELATMLDRSNRAKNFAPPVGPGVLAPRVTRAFRKMLVAREAGRVVATLTVEDTQDLRQNVLMNVPPSLRVALGLLRVVTLFVPKIGVPRLGRPLRILYVRFMACAEGQEAALRPLIAEARVQAFKQGYTFLSVGLHERDPLRRVVAGMPKLTFTSVMIATSLLSPNRVRDFIDQVAYEDFALV
jgi:GNAT superfamily N-acetyltransferase